MSANPDTTVFTDIRLRTTDLRRDAAEAKDVFTDFRKDVERQSYDIKPRVVIEEATTIAAVRRAVKVAQTTADRSPIVLSVLPAGVGADRSTGGGPSTTARGARVGARSSDERATRDAVAGRLRDIRQSAQAASIGADVNKYLGLAEGAESLTKISDGATKSARNLREASKEAGSLEKSLAKLGKGGGILSALGGENATKFLAAAGIARGAEGALNFGGAVSDYNYAMKTGNLDQQMAAQDRWKQSLSSIPVVGGLGTAIRENLDPTMRADRRAMEEQTKQVSEQEKINASRKRSLDIMSGIRQEAEGTTKAINAELADRRATSSEAKTVMQTQREIAEFEKKNREARQSAGVGAKEKDSEDVQSARAALNRKLLDDQVEEQRARDRESTERQRSGFDRGAERSAQREEGRGDAPAAARIRLQREIERANEKARDAVEEARRKGDVNGVSNLGDEASAIEAAGKRQLKAYDLESAREGRKRTLEKMREDTMALAEAESSIAVQNLRNNNQSYQADLEAFSAAWKQKIEIIKKTGTAEQVAAAEKQQAAEKEGMKINQALQTRKMQYRADAELQRASRMGSSASLTDLRAENEELIRNAESSGDPDQIAAAYSIAQSKLKQFQDQLKKTPEYSQSSMRDIYTQLQLGVFNDSGRARTERLDRGRAGVDAGADLKGMGERARKAQEDATKAQKEAAGKLSDAADKIKDAPRVGVLDV